MVDINDAIKYINSDDCEVFRPFGPKIYGGVISEEMHAKLIELAERVRGKKEHDYRQKLAGNLSEEFDLMQYRDEAPEVFEELMFHLSIYEASQPDEDEGGTPAHYMHFEKKLGLESAWVNFQKPFEWNPEHSHSGDISYVIYLKIPNDMDAEREHETQKGNSPTAGSISFGYGEENIYNKTTLNIIPKERDIIVFPHWLRHQVYPFTTDVERWSVAGNAYKTSLKEQALNKLVEENNEKAHS